MKNCLTIRDPKIFYIFFCILFCVIFNATTICIFANSNSDYIINSTYTTTAIDTDVITYSVGFGDIIKIDFIGARYMTAEHIVKNNGTINLPVFGDYYIVNKTLPYIEEELTKLYSKRLHNPQIKVFLVKSYKTEQTLQNNNFLEKLNLTIKR